MVEITPLANVTVVAPEKIVVPIRFSNLARQLRVDECIEIDEEQRHNRYNQARVANPSAKFTTRKLDGKCYLIRIE